MSVQLDWKSIHASLPEELPSGQQDLIPPDVYTMRVEKAEAGLAKSGNSKIVLTMVVADGPHKGRKVWGNINFAVNSPQSMAITVAQLAEFGITRQWLAEEDPSQDQIARKMTGALVDVKVAHREYEGKQYYDVRGYKAAVADDDSDPF